MSTIHFDGSNMSQGEKFLGDMSKQPSVRPKATSVARVSLLVPKALAAKLRKEAARQKRSLNSQVVMVLETAIAEEEKRLAAA